MSWGTPSSSIHFELVAREQGDELELEGKLERSGLARFRFDTGEGDQGRALLDHVLSGEPLPPAEFVHPLAATSRRFAWLFAGLAVWGHFDPVVIDLSPMYWGSLVGAAWTCLLLGALATFLNRGAGGTSVYQAAALVFVTSAVFLKSYAG